ncbi:hypothetical protein HHK36_008651 [Tetracentron sinense]|uniref:F-box domain-containing protein n=1 Tax=Tetracentron sinense TaxID=13715 RepID=A0A835DJI3_TETSI|nr:hypothetical protein HHK36_008651 [Tetracentron sinense]
MAAEKKMKMVIRKRRRNCRSGLKNSNRERPWSDLPNDLLEQIMGRISSSADQTRFRAVCKSWKSTGRVRPSNQLPWLLAYDDDSWNQCKLVDPTSKRTYTVNTIFNGEEEKKNITVCASKHGWLLLSMGSSVFLYCPFTNEKINLPNSETPFQIAAFSTTPTSPDCVFFGLFSSIHNTTIISTYRHGEETWTTHIFDNTFNGIKNVVYSQGIFYCANLRGALWTFDVAKKDWSMLEKPNAVLDVPSSNYQTYMVESQGDLILLVLLHNLGSWSRFFKLDRLRMAWVKIDSLGDQSLFLGCSSFSVSATRGMTGRIHYCSGYESMFFSQKTSQSTVHTVWRPTTVHHFTGASQQRHLILLRISWRPIFRKHHPPPFICLFTSVGSLLISTLMIGFAIVCAHGAFRVPEDLFLDDQEPPILVSSPSSEASPPPPQSSLPL